MVWGVHLDDYDLPDATALELIKQSLPASPTLQAELTVGECLRLTCRDADGSVRDVVELAWPLQPLMVKRGMPAERYTAYLRAVFRAFAEIGPLAFELAVLELDALADEEAIFQVLTNPSARAEHAHPVWAAGVAARYQLPPPSAESAALLGAYVDHDVSWEVVQRLVPARVEAGDRDVGRYLLPLVEEQLAELLETGARNFSDDGEDLDLKSIELTLPLLELATGLDSARVERLRREVLAYRRRR